MQNFEFEPQKDSDEIDLLDLLIVVAENIKLLILAPIFIGLTVFFGAYLLPESFESKSLLSVNKQGVAAPSQILASYIKSADILQNVAQDAGIGEGLGPSALERKMLDLVKVSVGKQDQLVSLTTTGATPEDAKELNYLVWKHVLPLTIPRGSERKSLEDQLISEQERLKSGRELELLTANRLEQGAASESTARLYGELLAANSGRQQRVDALKSQLEGLTLDNLAQQPTLSEVSVAPKKSLIAIAAALGSGFILLLFVFARHALRSSSKDPAQAQKLAQLRAAFRR